jgi:acetoacetyl-CoA reductase
LHDAVAIVTGGTRGIGEAISLALKDLGYTVAANYAGNEEKAKAFTEATGIAAYKWDVGDHEATLAGVAQVEADLGPVDVVVNNAGITRDGVLHRMTFDNWNEVIRVNLGGCFNMAKATFPGMRERGWGRIVNIGSINGQAGQYGQVNYAAAKSGIHGFTKALAQEGAKFGVTVNAIAPGYIDTEMVAAVPAPVLEKIVAKIPVGRLGHAEKSRAAWPSSAPRGRFRHRFDAEHQWRSAHVLIDLDHTDGKRAWVERLALFCLGKRERDARVITLALPYCLRCVMGSALCVGRDVDNESLRRG